MSETVEWWEINSPNDAVEMLGYAFGHALHHVHARMSLTGETDGPSIYGHAYIIGCCDRNYCICHEHIVVLLSVN